MTKLIITPERTEKIYKCESCKEFQREWLWGFIPAYCQKEGRILSDKKSERAYGNFLISHGEIYYKIPYWCPLPDGEV